jgi:hypothetical protein
MSLKINRKCSFLFQFLNLNFSKRWRRVRQPRRQGPSVNVMKLFVTIGCVLFGQKLFGWQTFGQCTYSIKRDLLIHQLLTNWQDHNCVDLTLCQPNICQPNICLSNICQQNVSWSNVSWPNDFQPKDMDHYPLYTLWHYLLMFVTGNHFQPCQIFAWKQVGIPQRYVSYYLTLKR